LALRWLAWAVRFLYGLAAEGQVGVYNLINEITEEMKRIMSMIGAENSGELIRGMLIEGP